MAGHNPRAPDNPESQADRIAGEAKIEGVPGEQWRETVKPIEPSPVEVQRIWCVAKVCIGNVGDTDGEPRRGADDSPQVYCDLARQRPQEMLVVAHRRRDRVQALRRILQVSGKVAYADAHQVAALDVILGP